MPTELSRDEYAKRFNEGYLISKEMPELAAQIIPAIGNTERGEAFKAGHDEFIAERNKSLYPSWLQDKSDGLDKDDNSYTEYDEPEKG